MYFLFPSNLSSSDNNSGNDVGKFSIATMPSTSVNEYFVYLYNNPQILL